VSADGSQFVFSTGEPALAGLKAGKIMALWGIAIRRITSVRESGGMLEVATSSVSLSEVFTTANIELDYAVRPTAPIVVPHVQAPNPSPPKGAWRRSPTRAFVLARFAADDGKPGASSNRRPPADRRARTRK
jgi:hypothetical protein